MILISSILIERFHCILIFVFLLPATNGIQARTILETLIDDNHSFHALTFNLSTVYELCTERSRAMKISLAEKVAEMQVKQGKKDGWEKVNGDFKL